MAAPTGWAEIDQLVDLGKLFVDGKEYSFQAEDLKEGDELGEGAFGTVTKMFHSASQTHMAVKSILLHDLRGKTVWGTNKKDILELAMVMQTGKCPYIVTFYGCLIRESEVWICMELMDSSMDKISERVYNDLKSRIPEDILGKMTVSVVKALHYLQSQLQIIHRDVKPSNILISRKGEFKLCDFGISGRLVDSIAKTRDVGCRAYMAPERIDRVTAKHGYTIRSDVWSFGITLVELAVGKFPYEDWYSSSILAQMNSVVYGPPPALPNDGTFSPELLKLSAACLLKGMDRRPSYDEIQEFEFFKKYESSEVDVAAWYEQIRERAD